MDGELRRSLPSSTDPDEAQIRSFTHVCTDSLALTLQAPSKGLIKWQIVARANMLLDETTSQGQADGLPLWMHEKPIVDAQVRLLASQC